jgi:2-dehydropantoate 2-reductase
MRHIVVGAGAIGCYVGGLLAAAGANVYLVGRPRITDVLRREGLRISDLDGDSIQVDASRLRALNELRALPPLNGEAVTVFLCVKCGATSEAARDIATALPPGTPVVSLQNGVENVARIHAAAPALEAIAGMVPFNVIQPQPQQVHRATSGQIRMARTPVTESLVEQFATAGLPIKLEHDMLAVQWGKLLLNLNNPVSALSDLPLREELLDRDYRRVLAALITEALAALKAAGITPAKVAAAPPRLLPAMLRLPTWAFVRVAARLLKIDPAARSSMWADLQATRVTEIGDLCGAVMRLGAQNNLAAPRNAIIQNLIEAHTPGRRYSGAELAAACGLS